MNYNASLLNYPVSSLKPVIATYELNYQRGKFVNDKHTILYDTDLQSEIYIEIDNGVPYCKHCKADDCSHVGFAICVEQFYGHRRGSGREETVKLSYLTID
jgi:hypothetical protein